MSKPVERVFRCTCGQEFTAQVYRSANVTLDPALGEAIAADVFNLLACPRCGRAWTAEISFLYHDMERDFAVWVYPEADEARSKEISARLRRAAQILTSSLGADLGEAGGSGTRVVFGMRALRDAIERLT